MFAFFHGDKFDCCPCDIFGSLNTLTNCVRPGNTIYVLWRYTLLTVCYTDLVKYMSELSASVPIF